MALKKALPGVCFNRVLRLGDEVFVKEKIVKSMKAAGQDLIVGEEMAQISPRIIPAGGARAFWIKGRGIICILSLLNTHQALTRVKGPVARVARGDHTVEHIDTGVD